MENKYWVSNIIDIGNIARNKKAVIKFQALPGIPKVIDLHADCGCTKVKYDDKLRVLQVVYSSGEIPKHIPGNQVIEKKVVVIYENDMTEQLIIKGLKIR